MRTTHAVAALAFGAVLTLAGCGRDEPSKRADQNSTSATDHNDADVAFAGDMIQHHAQALAMRPHRRPHSGPGGPAPRR